MARERFKQDAPDGSPLEGRKSFNEMTEDERAEFIPGQIFNRNKDEPAFIFSQENLRTIKRYESIVRALPRTKQELAATANFALLGIELEDVWRFHENLRTHINSWDRVEDACKLMGSDLQVFAESILVDGEEFIREIKGTEAWQQSGDATLDDISEEMLAVVPLSASDAKTFKDGVETHLGSMSQEIEEKLAGIRQVKHLVDRFGDDITENLKPMADSLMVHIAEVNIDEKLKQISRELSRIDREIEQKIKDYSALVGSAFYGLVFGPVGLLITGGIYGAKAEDVRAEKNLLIDRREELAKKHSHLISEHGAYDSLKGKVMDLEFRLVEVRTAAKHLEDVWVLLEAYAKSSLNRANSVSTNADLKRFVSQFNRVVLPWGKIRNISINISLIFNETVKDLA